ncbi:MAG: PKD domain-containing protein, partial [Dehalococcoidia bacterium]
ASDPDGDPLTYQWEFIGGRPDTATGEEVTTSFAGVSPPVVSLTVSDGRGGTVTVTDVIPLGFGVHYGPF